VSQNRKHRADNGKITQLNLILRRIIKIFATICQILRLKCTKISFGLQHSPDPLAGFKGTYVLKGGRRRGKGREGGVSQNEEIRLVTLPGGHAKMLTYTEATHGTLQLVKVMVMVPCKPSNHGNQGCSLILQWPQ